MVVHRLDRLFPSRRFNGKITTRHAFFAMLDQRDAKLTATFNTFRRPARRSVARFR